MPRYTFLKHQVAPFDFEVEVYLDNVVVAALPLQPKIQHGFAVYKLDQWIGRDNASNVVNYGERVSIERNEPLDLSTIIFK